MKKGKPTIGFRSAELHKRLTKVVVAANNEDISISSIARAAVREKLDRMEKELGLSTPEAHPNGASEASIAASLVAKERAASSLNKSSGSMRKTR